MSTRKREALISNLQTGDTTTEIAPAEWPELTKDEEAIASVGDRDELFKRERDGWEG
jgi:sulfite oxidase